MGKAMDRVEKWFGAGIWLLLNVLMVVMIPMVIWVAKAIIGFNVRFDILAPDYLAIIASVALNIFTYATECSNKVPKKRKNMWVFALIFSVIITLMAYLVYAGIFDAPIVKVGLMKTVLVVFTILLIIDAWLGVIIRKAYHETITQEDIKAAKKKTRVVKTKSGRSSNGASGKV